MQKRTWAARLLLLVFLPILVFSSLHIHDYVVAQGDCYECANHLHHSGHISLQTASFHDCVLCQFVSLPFLLALTLVVAVAVAVGTLRLVTSFSLYLSAASSIHAPRAPPVI